MNASRIGALVGLLLGVIAVCVGVWQAIVVLVLGCSVSSLAGSLTVSSTCTTFSANQVNGTVDVRRHHTRTFGAVAGGPQS